MLKSAQEKLVQRYSLKREANRLVLSNCVLHKIQFFCLGSEEVYKVFKKYKAYHLNISYTESVIHVTLLREFK